MAIIKKIIKIKNCPSFIDFTPDQYLPEFSRYNLIYGWNGSGKTSLSRVLRSFELGESFFNDPKKPSEYEFKLSSGVLTTNNNLSSFKHIRVFNKDFIEDSIFCEGGPKSIFFLGKESKEDKEKITKAETELVTLEKELVLLETKFNKANETKEKVLTDKAKEIKTTLTTPRNDSYRNYERPNLEKALKDNEEELKHLQKLFLSEVRLTAIKKSILQTSLENLNDLSIPNFNVLELEKAINDALSKSIVSQVIENLKTDEVISKWVEHGLEIHKDKKLITCAFCNQELPTNRIKNLENHFNDEYQTVLKTVQELRKMCAIRKIDVKFPESSSFYSDLTFDYLVEKKNAEETISKFNKTLDILDAALEKKEKNLFAKHALGKIDSIEVTPFNKINAIIKLHNQKTDNFENQIDKDKKDLELHFIADFHSTYKDLIHDCESSLKEYEESQTKVKQKVKEIKTFKENLISHHIPAQQINKDLEQFLGRRDIQLKASDAKDGYQIVRNGELAKNLSEGEKTALAIVYFLAKIKEDGFDLKNSVIVIDDPVSSLDSNAIFQAFSFIKESIKEAEQIFILTHHFDFFRQVKNWFKYCKDPTYFMVICKEESGVRKSSLIKIDDLLIKYESEYHFLFNVLYRLSKANEKDLEKVYSIPNVARKFLESFLAFRVPIINDTGEPSIRIRLAEIEFDIVKKTRIQRFVETHSHPRYESGIQDFDMTILAETSAIIGDLLELVKTEDEKHYNFLIKSVEI